MKKLLYLSLFILCPLFSFAQLNYSFNSDLAFIPNKGQIADDKNQPIENIDFKLQINGVNAYFNSEGIIYHFYREEDKDPSTYTEKERELAQMGDFNEIGKRVFFYRLDFKLIGANPDAELQFEEQSKAYTNYYLAHCKEGITKVPSYGKATYKNIYPNIDLVYLYGDKGLKYEFVVHPGGDASQIKFTYEGADQLSLNEGALEIANGFGPFSEQAPVSFYQNDQSEIPSQFNIENGEVEFVLEETDPSRTFVIDPTVTWSTYFDNGGNSDFHCNGAFDSAENLYLAYSTYSALWTTINAGAGQYYDATKDGITDVVIVRFNADYSQQWATYYGGDEGDYLCGTGGDYGKTLDVDSNDGIYLGGYANGNPTNFPTQSSGVGGAWYQDDSNLKGGDNSFIIKFDQNGVRQWGTLYQHTNVSTSGAGIRINGIKCNGTNVYFTGQTYQFSGFDIPLVNLAGAYYNPTFVGNQDIFLGRFDSDCILEWSTYYNSGNGAATGFQQGSDITFDASGNMILVGQISSDAASVNLVNPGGGAYFSNTISGGIDHIIAKFNTSLQPTWSTIIGGTALDRVSEVSTDPNGNILVASRMANAGMPTANPGGGAFYYATNPSGGADGFIMKFTPAGVYYWGTYVGGTTTDNSITGIASDASGNIYAIGYTQNTDFPIQNLAGAYNQAANAGNNDLVLMRFTDAGVNEWSTYYGGSGSDACYGRKIEPSTIASSCGYKQFFSPTTQSLNFPTTDPGGGAFFEGSLTGTSANTILLIEESGGATGSAPTSISGTTTICEGNSTTLTQVGGVLGTGDNYYWYSGSCGGTAVGTGTSVNVSPTTTTNYFVRVEGPCGITTCATVTVIVNTNSTDPTGITASANPICPSANTTLTVNGGSLGTGANWEWYTGSCGGTSIGSGNSIVVNPSVATTYYVRAEGTCNNTACQSITINVNSLSTDPSGITASSTTICDGQSTSLTVNGGSLGTGANWEWYTGSCGGTAVGSGSSINVSPSSTTTYYVRAEGTCNNTACQSVTITVNPVPTPSITSASTMCEGDNLNLTGTPAGGTWSVLSGPGTISTNVLTATGSGTINVEYSVTQAGCTGTTTQNITANALSDPSWTSPGTVCESGGTIDLNTLITGDTGGSWSGTGVTGSTFDPSGQSGNTITITYNVGSTCPASEQHDIMVETTVTATWTQPSALCQSDAPINLDTLITGSTGGSWSGSGVTGSLFDPAGLSGLIAVTYSVGGGSCSDMLTQDIEVLTSPATPTFSSSDSTICAGESVTLNGTGSGAVDYNIYDAPGGSLIGTAPLTLNPTTTTTYYMESVETNGCGNIGGPQSLTITVNPLPSLTVSSDENICLGESVTLTATGTGNLVWSTSETTNSIDVSPTATTTYTVTLTDGNNCSSNGSVTVNVQSNSTVNAVDDNTSTPIDQIVNTDVAANDTGDPLSVVIITGATNGVATVLTDGTIDYLPLSGFTGVDSVVYSICDEFCSSICDTAVLRISVDIEDELTVPGGFSPNGDGINETLIIDGLDAYPNNSLTIFNRWGDIVYTSAPYNNDWGGEAEGKGTLSGEEVVTGTYFYVLDLGDGTMMNGSIEIKK